jgi:DNA-binding transcriptional LysR family regulator
MYSAAPLLRSGELVALLPDYEPRAMDIYGVYTSRRQMPLIVRSVLDFLVEAFAHELPEH